MDVYQHWTGIKDKYKNLVIGIGNFDGVHAGHQELISKLVCLAQELEGTPAVMTFDPHPLAVLKPAECPPLLLSQESKKRIIAKLGAKALLTIPFNRELACMIPEEFVIKILHQGLGVKGVVIGYNYTFGYMGRGTAALMKEMSAFLGFQTVVIPPVKVEGRAVSSTLIRSLLISGEVKKAAKYLGFYPFVEGTVVGEKQRSGLFCSIVNLEINTEILVPAVGVYLARVFIDEVNYHAVASIKVKDKVKCIDVHLLDFCGDLYGKQIKASLISNFFNHHKQLEGDFILPRGVENDGTVIFDDDTL